MSASENNPSRVDQRGNVAFGNIAGRDINYYEQGPNPTHMGRLIREFREQRQQNERLAEIVASLDVFLRQSGSTPVGLDAKLTAAGREQELAAAAMCKELFHKKLTLYQLTPAAQEILAVALGMVFQRFQTEVRPLLLGGADHSEVSRALLSRVVEHVYEKLEDNPMNLGPLEVEGMVYYLTGNCHIGWT